MIHPPKWLSYTVAALLLYLVISATYVLVTIRHSASPYEQWLSLDVPLRATVQQMVHTDLLGLGRESYIVAIGPDYPEEAKGGIGIPGRVVIFEWRPRPWWTRWLFPWVALGGYTTVYSSPKELQTLEERTQRVLFYDPKKLQILNTDEDVIPEIAVWWDDGPIFGSGWRQSLQILKYDPSSKSYRGFVFDELRVSEMGGIYLEDLDGHGEAAIIKYDAIWGTDPSGEPECHVCPHRYRISIFRISYGKLWEDQQWNQGQQYITSERFSWDSQDVEQIIRDRVHLIMGKR